MILEVPDRFTVVQGYAGVRKTTQFRAVMSAIASLLESDRPRVVRQTPTPGYRRDVGCWRRGINPGAISFR